MIIPWTVLYFRLRSNSLQIGIHFKKKRLIQSRIIDGELKISQTYFVIMTSNLLLDVDVCSTSCLLLIGRRFERHELVDETTIFLRCDGCKDRSNRRSSHRFFHPTAQHVFRIGECRSNIGISFPAPWNDLGHTNYEGFLRIPHDESIHRYLPYLKITKNQIILFNILNSANKMTRIRSFA